MSESDEAARREAVRERYGRSAERDGSCCGDEPSGDADATALGYDDAVDVVLSDCVVNLSPDKPQVFREARRVLRPGGRLAISAVVLTDDLPPALRDDLDALSACVAGATPVERVESMLADAGFVDVRVEPRGDGAEIVENWDEERDLGAFLASAQITARAPDF